MNAANLTAGDRIAGPAIVTEDISTTVIDAGWEAEVLTQGELLLTDGRDFGFGNSDCEFADQFRNPKFRNPQFS